MTRDRISDIGMSRLVGLVSQMPDSVRQQLKEVELAHLRLAQKKSRHDITPEEKKEIQKKIDELIIKRDSIILGGWRWENTRI